MFNLPVGMTLVEQGETINKTTSGYITPIVIQTEDGAKENWLLKTYPVVHGGTLAEKRFYQQLLPEMDEAPAPRCHTVMMGFLLDEVRTVSLHTLEDMKSVLRQLRAFTATGGSMII